MDVKVNGEMRALVDALAIQPVGLTYRISGGMTEAREFIILTRPC